MLDKLFNWGKKKPAAPEPNIYFGRYSDNNKSVAKAARWTDADNFFKEKKYGEVLTAFFDYLRDDAAENVRIEKNGTAGQFDLFQGSKIVRGQFDEKVLRAEVVLARMPQPSVPVMRRLLEMNFSLYYSRFAMDKDRLCMRFDTALEGASPSKLYYGLKELATKADKQDDLLVQDFSILESTDSEHIISLSVQEKEIKYTYLQKWLKETLDLIDTLDADKFAGGIAYMLLSLAYRIDFLIAPEGKLLSELEKVGSVYFKKDERPGIEKNRDMIAAFREMQSRTKDEVFKHLFRSRYTFSIVAPQNFKTISDAIHAANQNMIWYRDNNYPQVACLVTEYGLSYCQYSYSLPSVITELFSLYMQVNYSDYFTALGFKQRFYNPETNVFDSPAIIEKIKMIQDKWKAKYPLMDFKTQNLRFDNLINFDQTFTTEIEFLNMEPK